MILSMSFKLTSVACVTVIEQNVIYQFQFLKIDYFLLRIRMSVFINNQYGKKNPIQQKLWYTILQNGTG